MTHYTDRLLEALDAENDTKSDPVIVIEQLTVLAKQRDPQSKKVFNLIALVLEKHGKDGGK